MNINSYAIYSIILTKIVDFRENVILSKFDFPGSKNYFPITLSYANQLRILQYIRKVTHWIKNKLCMSMTFPIPQFTMYLTNSDSSCS